MRFRQKLVLAFITAVFAVQTAQAQTLPSDVPMMDLGPSPSDETPKTEGYQNFYRQSYKITKIMCDPGIDEQNFAVAIAGMGVPVQIPLSTEQNKQVVQLMSNAISDSFAGDYAPPDKDVLKWLDKSVPLTRTTPELQGMMDSPGYEQALQECFGDNSFKRYVFTNTLIFIDGISKLGSIVITGEAFGVVFRLGGRALTLGARGIPKVLTVSEKALLKGVDKTQEWIIWRKWFYMHPFATRYFIQTFATTISATIKGSFTLLRWLHWSAGKVVNGISNVGSFTYAALASLAPGFAVKDYVSDHTSGNLVPVTAGEATVAAAVYAISKKQQQAKLLLTLGSVGLFWYTNRRHDLQAANSFQGKISNPNANTIDQMEQTTDSLSRQNLLDLKKREEAHLAEHEAKFKKIMTQIGTMSADPNADQNAINSLTIDSNEETGVIEMSKGAIADYESRLQKLK